MGPAKLGSGCSELTPLERQAVGSHQLCPASPSAQGCPPHRGRWGAPGGRRAAVWWPHRAQALDTGTVPSGSFHLPGSGGGDLATQSSVFHPPPLERLPGSPRCWQAPPLILRPTPSQPHMVPSRPSVCLGAGAPEGRAALIPVDSAQGTPLVRPEERGRESGLARTCPQSRMEPGPASGGGHVGKCLADPSSFCAASSPQAP